MLSPIDETVSSSSAGTTTEPAPDKQIGARSNTNGAVFYTVPAGRVFNGWVSNDGSNQGTGYYTNIVVDGVDIIHRGTFSTAVVNYKTGSPAPKLTLLAGTSVKNYGGSVFSYVFGVESDA